MSHHSAVAPSAEKVVCVDFDATLYPWGPLYSYARPLPGAVAAVNKLRDAGFSIVIFTSRLSPTWWEAERRGGDPVDPHEMQGYIEDVLARDGIPYDYITSEKVPATAYIDDRGVRFEGDWVSVLAHFGLA